jgi:hypothetical protein
VQIGHRHDMGVVPAAARRAGSELDAAAAMRRDKRRTLLLSAIHFRRNQHAMPVDEFRGIGVVDDVDSNLFPLAHAQHRSRSRPVVTDCRENMSAVKFHCNGRDMDRVVRVAGSCTGCLQRRQHGLAVQRRPASRSSRKRQTA